MSYVYRPTSNPYYFDVSTLAVAWNASGTASVTFPSLGFDSSGHTYARPYAINDNGLIVGTADQYVDGVLQRHSAMRWDVANPTQPAQLGIFGTPPAITAHSAALDINASGTAVGYQEGATTYALLWPAGSSTPISLGSIGTAPDNSSAIYANFINDAGVIAGCGLVYDNAHVSRGFHALRWMPGETSPTVLDNIGTSAGSMTMTGINASGAIIGHGNKVDDSGSHGPRAALWLPGSTATTLLGTLQPRATDDYSDTKALAISDTGYIIGTSSLYVADVYKGSRAVRWNPGSLTPTELIGYGFAASGDPYTTPADVNDAGLVVGNAGIFNGSGAYQTIHATVWLPGSSMPTDLNTLGVQPLAGTGTWVLTNIAKISADGWATGGGYYDPDGVGPQTAQTRSWSAQLGFGGSWTTATGVWRRGLNWSTGTPATRIGDALFNRAGNTAVSLDRNEATQTINILNGDVTVDLAGHELAATNGLLVSSGKLTIGSVVAGAKVIGTLNNNATLAPGPGVGALTIQGAFSQGATGTLELDVSATQRDGLTITDVALLAGKLQLNWSGDTNPALAKGLIALQIDGARSGTFTTIGGVALSPTRALAVTYDDHHVLLNIARPGDTNLDGSIDFDDLLTLAQNYGASGRTWSLGDFDGSGVTNFDDLLTLAQNYGFGTLSESSDFAADWTLAQSLVPEPTLGIAALLLSRRRDRTPLANVR